MVYDLFRRLRDIDYVRPLAFQLFGNDSLDFCLVVLQPDKPIYFFVNAQRIILVADGIVHTFEVRDQLWKNILARVLPHPLESAVGMLLVPGILVQVHHDTSSYHQHKHIRVYDQTSYQVPLNSLESEQNNELPLLIESQQVQPFFWFFPEVLVGVRASELALHLRVLEVLANFVYFVSVRRDKLTQHGLSLFFVLAFLL